MFLGIFITLTGVLALAEAIGCCGQRKLDTGLGLSGQ